MEQDKQSHTSSCAVGCPLTCREDCKAWVEGAGELLHPQQPRWVRGLSPELPDPR